MKKYFVGFLIGIFVCGIIGVSAANYLYKADEVSYTPKDDKWNVNNVDSAINDLYDKANSKSDLLLKSTPLYKWTSNTSYTLTKDAYLSGTVIGGTIYIDGVARYAAMVIDNRSYPSIEIDHVHLKAGTKVELKNAQFTAHNGDYRTTLGIYEEDGTKANLPILKSTPLYKWTSNTSYVLTTDAYLSGSIIAGSVYIDNVARYNSMIIDNTSYPSTVIENLYLKAGTKVELKNAQFTAHNGDYRSVIGIYEAY